jgi:hypothetical protein
MPLVVPEYHRFGSKGAGADGVGDGFGAYTVVHCLLDGPVRPVFPHEVTVVVDSPISSNVMCPSYTCIKPEHVSLPDSSAMDVL